jgi:hypothetical protein
MSKTKCLVVAAALLLAGVTGWATTTMRARTATYTAPAAVKFDTLLATSTAKDLPAPAYNLY